MDSAHLHKPEGNSWVGKKSYLLTQDDFLIDDIIR